MVPLGVVARRVVATVRIRRGLAIARSSGLPGRATMSAGGVTDAAVSVFLPVSGLHPDGRDEPSLRDLPQDGSSGSVD